MSTVKKNQRTVQKEKLRRFSFFSDMDPVRKADLLKYSGIAVGIFALFTLVSVLSYLFTWQADQSLYADPEMFDKEAEVFNWGGKLGYRWSRFLVSSCFGLGSFILIFLTSVYAFRLFFWRRRVGLVRMTLLSVFATLILSVILSYAASLFGQDISFGGGVGGDAGAAVSAWFVNLLGPVVTAFVLLAVVIAWFLVASGRFRIWFSNAGESTEEEPENAGLEPYEAAEEEAPADVCPEESDCAPEDTCNEFLQPSRYVSEELSCEPVLTEDTEGLPLHDDTFDVVVTEIPTEVEEELPRIDNRAELKKYEFPGLDILEDYSSSQHRVSQQELEMNNNRIRATLQNYRIELEKVTAVVGPTVTLYKVVPAPGVKVATIENLHREIAMALGARGLRIVTLPDCIGIEVANSKPSIVSLKSMLNSDSFRESKADLPIAIGHSIIGQEVKTFDLADAPHLLVAGATKQGKSVGLNVIISSLLYAKHPSELKFVFIDPKMVEFTAYNALLKHYLAVLPMAASEEDEREKAIVKDPKQAESILNSLCIEMDERYNLLRMAGVNDLKLYNEKYKDRRLLPTDGHKYLPYLVVVIDEYADLTMSGGTGNEARKSAKNIESSIVRLAQKGRAAGIHVIIATQRPSVNVITGLIKTNFPTRIAFRVVSGVDSRTILDATGAENLIGRGDMLYYAGVEMERVQCALVSMEEITRLTRFIGSQTGYEKCYNTPYYLPVPVSQDGESGGGTIDMQNIDSMFEEAARMVVMTQKGSTSDLQRKLGMGYARAGRVMDQLEGAGIVGPQEGSKPRQVLVADFAELDEILSHFI